MTAKLSRRAALTGLASIGAASSAVVPSLTHSAEADAELIALGNRFDELEWQYRFVKERDRPRNQRYSELLKEVRGRPLSIEEWPQALNEIGKQLDQEFGPATKPDLFDIIDMLDAPQRRIMAMPAATLPGLAIKARVTRFACEHFWQKPVDDLDWDQMMARKLIDAVLEFCDRADVAR
jgi:hypothetical protein